MGHGLKLGVSMPTKSPHIKHPVSRVIGALASSPWTAESLRGHRVTGNFIADCKRRPAPEVIGTLMAKI